MDKQSKTWIVLIGGTVLLVIAGSLIFKFWQIAIVGAVCFGLGYMLGYRGRRSKK